MRQFLALLFYDMAIGLAGSRDELSHFRKRREFKFAIKASEENDRRIANAKSTSSKAKTQAKA